MQGGNIHAEYKLGENSPSAGLFSHLMALRIPFFIVREVANTLACSSIAVINASFICGSLGRCAGGRISGLHGNYADGAGWGVAAMMVECYGLC